MMLRRIYLYSCFILTFGLSSFAYAEHITNSISVTAEPQKVSATTIGKNLYFSKQFKLLVINLGKVRVDLSDGCFIGYDKSNRPYYIDIIDERLKSTVLERQKSVQGMVVFSSDNEQVQTIQYVRFNETCS